MKYMIDTNMLSAVMRSHAVALQTWQRMPSTDLLIPAIVVAEGLYGAHKGRSEPWLRVWRQVLLDYSVVPFDGTCTEVYGWLRADLERRGCMIGLHDCQISATALAWQQTHPNEQVTLVTDNTREFERIPGLRLDNWLDG